jgi:serine/threonine-protein kinase RsbW
MSAKVAIQARNALVELDRLNEFLAAFWASNQLPEDAIFDFNLSLDEVFTNIVQHGYTDLLDHEIDIELLLENGTVVITVEDEGVPFNPLDVPEADVTLPLHERSIGGLGIFLVRKLMDEIEYSRSGNRNRLVMKKKVPWSK